MRNFCDTSNQQQSQNLVSRFSLGQQYRFWKTDINAAVRAAQDSANSSTESLDGASAYQRGQQGYAAVMSLGTVRQLVSACEVLSDELRRGSSEVATQRACYSLGCSSVCPGLTTGSAGRDWTPQGTGADLAVCGVLYIALLSTWQAWQRSE